MKKSTSCQVIIIGVILNLTSVLSFSQVRNIHAQFGKNAHHDVWISWRDTAAAASYNKTSVIYGLSAGSLTLTSDSIEADHQNYHILLHGLTEYTTYYYQIQGSTVVGKFRTAPYAPKETKFAVIGDVQLSNTTESAVNWVPACRFLADQNLDFVIYEGDLVSRGNYQVGFDQLLHPYASPSNPKIADPDAQRFITQTITMACVGNHEGYQYSAEYGSTYIIPHDSLRFRRYCENFRFPDNGNPDSYFRSLYHAFEFGDAAFISDYEEFFPISRPWLTNLLDTCTKSWKFISNHIPLYSTSCCWTRDVSDKTCSYPVLAPVVIPYSDLMDNYEIDILFGGHSHRYEYTYPIKGYNSQGGKAVSYRDYYDASMYFVTNDGSRGGGFYYTTPTVCGDEPTQFMVNMRRSYAKDVGPYVHIFTIHTDGTTDFNTYASSDYTALDGEWSCKKGQVVYPGTLIHTKPGPGLMTNSGSANMLNTEYKVYENEDSVVFGVQRLSGGSGAVSISYSTNDGTALQGTDYTQKTGVINWANGDMAPKYITIFIPDNTEYETNKDFTVILSAPAGGIILGTPSTTKIVILDDEKVQIVTISQKKLMLAKGKIYPLVTTTIPGGALIKNVLWKSLDTNIITVNPTGLVFGKAAGTSYVVVSSVDGGVTDTCKVVVTDEGNAMETFINLKLPEFTGGAFTGANGVCTYTGDNGENWTCLYAGRKEGGITGRSIALDTRLETTIPGGLDELSFDMKTFNVLVGCQVFIDGISFGTYTPAVVNVAQKFTITGIGKTSNAVVRFAAAANNRFLLDNISWVKTGTVAVKGIKLLPAGVPQLEAGTTIQLVHLVMPVNATDKIVTWSSNNGAVASVDGSGLVTGLTPGIAVITVKTTDGNFQATCSVTVYAALVPVAVTGVSVTPANHSMGVGGIVDLAMLIAPGNATNKAVTWSSDNGSVATVNSSGRVTGVSVGTAKIIAVTTDGGFKDTCDITVSSSIIAVTGVSVLPISAAIETGDSVQLTATIAPVNATDKTVTWSSGNAAVATVNSSGLVKAVSPGTAIITVKTTDGNYQATCTITVTNPVISVTGVSVSPSSAALGVGGSVLLSAVVSPVNATNKTIVWSSNNTAVATVDSTGNVKAIGAGSAIITAKTSDGNFTSTCSVTVSTIALKIPAAGSIIYPNPATETITVINNGMKYNNMQIFDQTGREVMNSVLRDELNIINITMLQKGMYIIKLLNEENMEITKIIIQ